uniref:FH2 domain-containing protein n=1 Tax=Panagrolaimus sp. JU765 TaxID=591449 RepID=A0AC34RI76_9BILA
MGNGRMNGFSGIPPAPPPVPGIGVPPPPPLLGNRGRENSVLDKGPTSTVKLHWKPAQAEAPPIPMLKRKGTFWNRVETTPTIDTSKLARLFEQKAKEVTVKKPGEVSKPQVLQVLSLKRSQAINIGLTKLPPISVIPTAIRKFDTTVLNKEGIEKILQTMMPHTEEIERIHEKMGENPDMPLGQAEQFMLSLSEIDCLLERLKLWLFMLDFPNVEKDVAESLMELNNAMKEVEESETFRVAMGMLLSIGNALNGTDIKAFQLEYLSKAGEVKDPVHKYPLTYHLAEYMLDNYPAGTDLHSEFGAVSRKIERIHEKMGENPDMPLGQAEQFMLSLSEIDCLLERLKLWLFMLDFPNVEKDVAESLMELNNAMKEVEESETFRVAMGMLLSIGNALNGTDIKAFQLEYLSKAGEVKDPVHKYPLTYHLAEYMLDNYPAGTDLHSEFGAVSRSSKIDFEAVHDNLKKMESDCKNCWIYVSKISQKDNNTNMKNKINNYLTEVAERIHRLKHIHMTANNRWKAFLLYFGYAANEIKDQKPMAVFKMVNEFALEYRTNREKILQMRKRMAEKRERNKTRGMMIGVAQKQAAQTNGFDYLKKPTTTQQSND